MIQIEQNQIVPENPNLRVLSVSGDYDDNDLIECATLERPDFALSAFSATFIRYGNIVNQFSDPFALGEALLKIDPDCTHDTATLFKEEEMRRIKREGGDFTPENPVPADENVSPIAEKEKEEEELVKIEEIKETKKVDDVAPSPLSSDNSATTTSVVEQTPKAAVRPETPIPVSETPPTPPETSSEITSETPGPIKVIIDSVSNAVN